MRTTIVGWMCGATLGLGLAITQAQAAPMVTALGSMAEPEPLLETVQYYEYGPRRSYGPPPRAYYGSPPRAYGPRYGYGPRPVYRDRSWRRRDDGLAAGLAAGAIGALAIGGLAASGAFDPQPRYAPIAPERRQWCAQRYRSYNPADGTFVGNDGRRRFCG